MNLVPQRTSLERAGSSLAFVAAFELAVAGVLSGEHRPANYWLWRLLSVAIVIALARMMRRALRWMRAALRHRRALRWVTVSLIGTAFLLLLLWHVARFAYWQVLVGHSRVAARVPLDASRNVALSELRCGPMPDLDLQQVSVERHFIGIAWHNQVLFRPLPSVAIEPCADGVRVVEAWSPERASVLVVRRDG